jgi:outer membrane protein OmpA-like peptidoglycan-associated protein
MTTIENAIRTDVQWQFETDIENQAINAINRLKKEGKMSDDEVKNLYETNFKKILQSDINKSEVLVNKSLQIQSITNKLLAVHLSKQNQWTVEAPSMVKRAIYWTSGIDQDIQKNWTSKNLAKWVIDEVLSIPEMLIEAVKHPIDFATWLKTALVDNFSQTMHAIKEQFTDIAWWIQTPETAYKTGKSSVLILLTFFPGAIGKTLLNIGKNTAKLAVKTTKSVAKEWVVATWKKAINTVWKWIVDSKVGKFVDKWVTKWVDKYKNVQSKNVVKNTSQELQKLTDDIASKQKQLTKDQGALKMKNITESRKNELNSNIAKTNKEIADLTKKQSETLVKQKSAGKIVKETNTKIWIDNKKVWVKKRLENNAMKLWDDIVNKQKQLVKEQNALKRKWIKPERVKELNDNIAKINKEIAELTKKQKDLVNKAKNYDVRVAKAPRESIRKNLLPQLKKMSISALEKIRTSPQRIPVLSKLFKLRTLNGRTKKLWTEVKTISEKLNVKNKKWVTKLENAKKNPNLRWAKKTLLLDRQLESINKAMKTFESKRILAKKELANDLVWLWVIAYASLLTDSDVRNLSEYLVESNDEFIQENQSVDWLETGKTEINSDIINVDVLNALSESELKDVKITITWMASKTWTTEINQKIAQQRAENARKELVEKYCGLDTANIQIETAIQPTDNWDDLWMRQWVKIDVKMNNQSYVDGYNSIKPQDVSTQGQYAVNNNTEEKQNNELIN